MLAVWHVVKHYTVFHNNQAWLYNNRLDMRE